MGARSDPAVHLQFSASACLADGGKGGCLPPFGACRANSPPRIFGSRRKAKKGRRAAAAAGRC